MDNRDAEKRLKSAIDHVVPDVLEGILSGCNAQKGRVLPMQKKPRRVAAWAAAAAAIVMLAGGLLGWRQYDAVYRRADAVIGLDVNPGIELTLNKAERVLSVQTFHKDAVRILDGMDLAGTHMDVAVNALIGSMLKQGFIGEDANSILISVESQDAARGDALQAHLVSQVDGILKGHAVDGAILSQTIQESADIRSLSQELDVSSGKAQLIQQLAQEDPTHPAADLAGMTIHEMNLLLHDDPARLAGLQAVGSPDAQAYLGEAQALAAALAHARVQEKDLLFHRIHLDWDDGRVEYELEFATSAAEYDCDVDAVTGAILSLETKCVLAQTVPPALVLLSQEEAVDAALKHALLSVDAVFSLRAHLDEEDGRPVYEVQFFSGDMLYEYEVDAVTGAILSFSMEPNEIPLAPPAEAPTPKPEKTPKPAAAPSPAATAKPVATPQPVPAPEGDIGKEKAKTIALQHAGYAAGEVTGCRVEKDWDDGRSEYGVEFRVGNVEYEYEIDAVTGSILDWDKDIDDD